MAKNDDTKKIPIHIITSSYQIIGFVKVPPSKQWLLGKKFFSKRLSDILFYASERMLKKGEQDFINLTNAEIIDISTGRVIRSAIPYLAVNKSAIQAIIPMNVAYD